MTEKIFEVSIPDELLQYGIDQTEVQRRLIEWLIISLFSDGQISSGKAAKLLNISRIDFLSLLRTRGIAYINYSPHELAEEFAAVDTLGTDEST